MNRLSLLRLRSEDVPAWYELGLESDHTMRIAVCRQAKVLLDQELRQNNSIVEEYLELYSGLPRFISPTTDGWGLGAVLLADTPPRPDWVAWKCSLPDNSGLAEYEQVYVACFQVEATLGCLFKALGSMEEDSRSELRQLLAIKGMYTDRSSDFGHLSVVISPQLARWAVSPHSSEQAEQVKTAMMMAYKRLTGGRFDPSPSEFKVEFINGHIIRLDCPGSNSCGIGPESGLLEVKSVGGYELFSHNAYYPEQQLTILVGLAKIHMLARAAGF